jgi:WD40 repeat protein
MQAYVIRTRGDDFAWQQNSRRVQWLSWPTLLLLAAIVAAASQLFGKGDEFQQALASQTMIANSGMVKAVAFRPDGAMLLSVGFDGSMAILDLAARRENPDRPQGVGRVRCAAFSADSRVLAVSTATTSVSLHDLVDHQSRTLNDVRASTTGAVCLAFSPDGATLAVGQQDGRITLWDAGTGRNRSTLPGHAEFVASMAFASAGATLASSGGDLATRVWDLATGREVLGISSPKTAFVALAFSADGRLLCLGEPTSPAVRIWDVTRGVEHAILRGPTAAVVALGISPDGATLAAADYRGAVTFWDLATLKLRSRRLRHAGVRSLAFAPGGRALATGGFDGTIHLWASPIASDE